VAGGERAGGGGEGVAQKGGGYLIVHGGGRGDGGVGMAGRGSRQGSSRSSEFDWGAPSAPLPRTKTYVENRELGEKGSCGSGRQRGLSSQWEKKPWYGGRRLAGVR